MTESKTLTHSILWAANERPQIQLQWILNKLINLVNKLSIVPKSLEVNGNDCGGLVNLSLLPHQHLGLAALTGELGLNLFHLSE